MAKTSTDPYYLGILLVIYGFQLFKKKVRGPYRHVESKGQRPLDGVCENVYAFCFLSKSIQESVQKRKRKYYLI